MKEYEELQFGVYIEAGYSIRKDEKGRKAPLTEVQSTASIR